MRFVKPLDEKLLHAIFTTYNSIVTIEDGVIKGGFGSAILEFAAEHNYNKQIKILGLPDQFIDQGRIDQLQAQVGLSIDNIKSTIASLVL